MKVKAHKRIERDPTTQLVYQLLGRSLLEIDRSYWAVKLDNDEWVCEARMHTDVYRGVERQYEWYEDIVANGDGAHIKELWLLCPANKLSPLGNTARLPILQPWTAFDFKVNHASSNFVQTWKTQEAHIIGRVDDKATGDCTCFIWDDRYSVLCEPFCTNVYNFGTWKSSLPPRGELALEKIGVKL